MVCQASVYTGIRADGLSWTNWSGRVTRTRESYFVPAPSPNAAVPGVLIAPLGLMQLVNVIAAATAASKHVHAVGTGWAYEDLAVGDNWTISLERLASRLLTTVGATTDRHGAAGSGPGLTDEWFHRQLDPLASTRLLHIEAGITIGALVDLMQADALALPTLGGANGQSLAGAINTSTHGGDWDQPPLPDAVRAIHLVTDGGRELWIEPASRPITVDQRLRSTLSCPTVEIVRSDEMFDAAVVGLGRFGVVYSYVLEVRSSFNVAEWVTQPGRAPVLAALRQGLVDPQPFARLFQLLDAAQPPATLPEATGHAIPYFWQLVFSSRDSADLWVQRRWLAPNNPHISNLAAGPAPVSTALALAIVLPDFLLPGGLALMDAEARLIIGGDFTGAMSSERRGPHALLTSGTTAYSKNIAYRADSIEVVFDARTADYLDFLDAIQRTAPGFAQCGYISVRPSRSSNATMSMHNVASDHAISIEVTSLSGLPGNAAWMSLVHAEALARRGRPHWGQINTLDLATTARLYGAHLDAWGRALNQVSGGSSIFSNTFTRARGLEPRMAFSQIDVSVPAPDQLLVAATGPTRSDFWGPRDGGGWGWHGWQTHELATPHGSGQVSLATEGDRTTLVRAGFDGWIYHSQRGQNGSWSGWGVAGRSNEREFQAVPGGPVHTTSTGAGSLHVTYADRDGWVVASRGDTTGGTLWPETARVRGGFTSPGGHVTGVSRSPGQLDVFMVGRDAQVYTAAWNAQNGWAGWWVLPGISAPPGAPVGVVSRSIDHLDIFAADSTGRTMATAWAPATGWAPWVQIGSGRTSPGGHITGVCRSRDQIDVFTTGTDSRLATASWNPNHGWAGWWTIGNSQAAEPGAVIVPVSRSTDLIDAFYVDRQGVVQTVGWSPANGWGGPWLVA